MSGMIYWAEREQEIPLPVETGAGGQQYRQSGATYRVLAHTARLTIPLVNDWLYGLLSTDAAIAAIVGNRIYEEERPQGSALPALVYQSLSGVPVSVIGGEVIYSNLIYLVKGITTGASSFPVRALMNRVDERIHQSQHIAVS